MDPNEIMVCKAKLFHPSAPLQDVYAKVKDTVKQLGAVIKPGSRIAVAVGSRGIANIAVITKALTDYLKQTGAEPFIIPAMGSHGGATAEGQAEFLQGYGISEKTIGVPVISSMEVEYIGDAGHPEPFPVYIDKNAFNSDGVIIVNRVKSHTDFHGDNESGIIKMLVIGLGKHKQAALMHRYGADGLRDLVPVAAKKVLSCGKIIGGLGILEDGYDETSDIVFASPDEFFNVDSALLKRSKELMAKLPFDAVDSLIIDKMGKDISGSGMDTNIIGRLRIKGQTDTLPDCDRIAVLDLTDTSHGNATGVGLADITTRRLVDKIDWQATNANIITSGFLQRGFLPVVAENDIEAVDLAVNGANHTPESIKFARIKSTLDLAEVYVSKALLSELISKNKGEQTGEFIPLVFKQGGRLADF